VDIDRFHLDGVATLLCQDPKIVAIADSTKGSACTALFAVCQLPQNDPLLIVSANEFVDLDLAEVVSDFVARDLDGGALIFRSVHPRYSYVRLDNDGLVTEAAQRNPISKDATAGIFWFGTAGLFCSAAMSMIRKGCSVDGQYYLAPVFNELILEGNRVGVFPLGNADYHLLKTVSQAEQFEFRKL